jgi:glycosyltransferase involved in cell wall biosynthesis
VVSTVGGPAELILEGVTGLKVGGRDLDELRDAMVRLMDAGLRTRLGRQARAYTEARRVDEPFTAIFDADAYRRQSKGRAELSSDVFEAPRSYVTEPSSFGEAKSVA